MVLDTQLSYQEISKISKTFKGIKEKMGVKICK